MSKISWIEKLAGLVGLVPRERKWPDPDPYGEGLLRYPPFEKWLEVEDLDSKRKPRRLAMVPTSPVTSSNAPREIWSESTSANVRATPAANTPT